MQLYDEILYYTKNIKILYAEDEVALRENSVEFLEPYFKSIIGVSDGVEALSAFEKDSFNIVITDIMMPNKNGIELCEDLRKINSSLPIIVTSACQDQDSLIDLISIGITRFIAKPIDAPLLLSTLVDICKKICFDQQETLHKEQIEVKNNLLKSQNLELQKLNYRLEEAERLADIGYWEWNPYTDYQWYSKQVLLILGFDEKSDNKPTVQWFIEHTISEDQHLIADAIEKGKKGEVFSFRCRLLDFHGIKKSIMVTAESYFDENKNVMIGTMQNVTELSNLEQKALLASEIIDNCRESVVVTDANLKIIEVNAAFTKISEYESQEVIGLEPSMLSSGWHDSEFYKKMWESINGSGHWEGEIWDRKKGGGLYAGWLNIFNIKDCQGKICNYVGMFTDITQLKKEQEKIANLAYFDPLTKLPNRSLFHDRLQKSLEHAKRKQNYAILLFIDMDNFKIINDTLGHKVGDLFLMEIAQRLKSSIRESDTAARLGGDEFTIIIPDVNNVQDGGMMAGRVLKSFRTPCQIQGHEIHCSGSIGIAVYNKDSYDLDTLLKHADTAMYHAKEQGKNTFRYYESKMQESFGDFIEVEHALWEALKNNEFELYFQPIMNSATNVPMSMEALIRWNKNNEIVLPSSFIPVAEKTELIFHIGRWVINEAISQFASWKKEQKEISISINISPKQFKDKMFAQYVQSVLESYEIDGEGIFFEITESVMIDNPESVITIMHTLKKMGIRFSLDDFGSGYSSLNYLRMLPIDNVKIDKTFVMNSDTNTTDRDVIAGIVHIAHSLNLKVIAEGSETLSQNMMLKEQKCDAIQGFYHSRPIPSLDVAEYLRGRSNE